MPTRKRDQKKALCEEVSLQTPPACISGSPFAAYARTETSNCCKRLRIWSATGGRGESGISPRTPSRNLVDKTVNVEEGLPSDDGSDRLASAVTNPCKVHLCEASSSHSSPCVNDLESRPTQFHVVAVEEPDATSKSSPIMAIAGLKRSSEPLKASFSPLKQRLQASLVACSNESPDRHGASRNKGRPQITRWQEQCIVTGGTPPQQAVWEPPVSPFGLIEEQLYHDPWKLLLACLLLNKTTAVQVRKVWSSLTAVIPNAEEASKADPDMLEAIIRPLGFYRFRARAIVAMSEDYMQPWKRPSQLRFVGKYASDAYFMFCRGMWQALEPDDKDLRKYHAWLMSTGGQGQGLQRDELL